MSSLIKALGAVVCLVFAALPARADSIVVTPDKTIATTTVFTSPLCSLQCSGPVVINYTVDVDNSGGFILQVVRNEVTPSGFIDKFLSDTCSGQTFPSGITTFCTASVSWIFPVNPANLPVTFPVQLFYFNTGPFSVPVTAGTTTITILQPTPEPSSLLLLGTGLLGLVGAVRRKWLRIEPLHQQ